MGGSTDRRLRRRDFLKAAAVTTAGLTVVQPGSVFGAQAANKIQLGLIGCGGRGGWIADLFEKNSNTKLVAVADYFQDRCDDVGGRFQVDSARRHKGIDGYRKLLNGKVDAVAIESPPYFHPEQAVAATEAGKHVYIAKPIAVDVPGCMAIVEAAKKVKGKLSVLADFQTRNNEFFKEAAKRVHEGAIGKLVCGQIFYHTGSLGGWGTPGPTTFEGRLRRWVADKALSGDIIVEQNIHVLDVANWYMGSHPIKAQGACGKGARLDADCNDHFVVTFWYPNDVLVDFASSQFLKGFDDMCMRVFGSIGTVDSHYGGQVTIRGDKGWRGGTTGDIYQSGAVNNIKDFCASIANGTYLDNAQESAESNMTCILGRMAAYSGKPVTWDEMVKANEKLDAKVDQK